MSLDSYKISTGCGKRLVKPGNSTIVVWFAEISSIKTGDPSLSAEGCVYVLSVGRGVPTKRLNFRKKQKKRGNAYGYYLKRSPNERTRRPV
jgi:hypothetical protein